MTDNRLAAAPDLSTSSSTSASSDFVFVFFDFVSRALLARHSAAPLSGEPVPTAATAATTILSPRRPTTVRRRRRRVASSRNVPASVPHARGQPVPNEPAHASADGCQPALAPAPDARSAAGLEAPVPLVEPLHVWHLLKSKTTTEPPESRPEPSFTCGKVHSTTNYLKDEHYLRKTQ
jgi:hypothetical protein